MEQPLPFRADAAPADGLRTHTYIQIYMWGTPPIIQHRAAAPTLWPLMQKIHPSHLGGLHPEDVMQMVPFVHAGNEEGGGGAPPLCLPPRNCAI